MQCFWIALVVALASCAAPPPQQPPSSPLSTVSVAPEPRPHAPVPLSQETLAQRAKCEAGDLWACILVGLAFERGDGAPADLPSAAHYYQLACDTRIAEACALLVNVYSAGGEGVPRDPERVASLKQLLCEDGHEIHCAPVVEDTPFDDPTADP
ncbi:MAG: tetratricopeptide repeat protein [Kofleriaceae bacterium]